jgi:hypothetical protein
LVKLPARDFPWRGLGIGGFFSGVVSATTTSRSLAAASLSNSCDVRGVSVMTGADGSNIEYCETEAVSALLLLLSLLVDCSDVVCVDAGIA